MVKAKLYNKEGQEKGEVQLNPKIFEIEANEILVKQAIEAVLANRRLVIADTKNRGEVRGGGKKPWNQKGTGRARHGSIRSPLWRGGGVTFGPNTDRNFTKKINKKVRTTALLMALSDKVKNEKTIVIDELNAATGKTKELSQALKGMKFNRGLIVLPKMEKNLVRALNNLPRIELIAANSLNVYDVVKAYRVLFVEAALKETEKTFLSK
ncbi:MAG: 50S ribosomal protein L4 [Parcubacteria group bacterium GW2011_GWC2_39_14]|nr:MAG: 50S ribosomal protein L4 [Parcubacteria group bacterium GW2011_GWC2_39_14]KKR55470.1 MAG: 50S ribosomal protein L4 [Parcubacteria group bacterium GW2011_GWA2_40_23]